MDIVTKNWDKTDPRFFVTSKGWLSSIKLTHFIAVVLVFISVLFWSLYIYLHLKYPETAHFSFMAYFRLLILVCITIFLLIGIFATSIFPRIFCVSFVSTFFQSIGYISAVVALYCFFAALLPTVFAASFWKDGVYKIAWDPFCPIVVGNNGIRVVCLIHALVSCMITVTTICFYSILSKYGYQLESRRTLTQEHNDLAENPV